MSAIHREMFEGEQSVYNELIKAGYPEKSIVMEGKLDSRRFVDFIINDVDTGLPVMIIEVKSHSPKTRKPVRQIAFENLKRIYEKSSFPLKAIAAILDREAQTLEFVDFTEAVKENNFDSIIDNYVLPPYEVLTIGAHQKAIEKQKEKQEKNISVLKILCWLIFPLICIGLLILDAVGIYAFSTLRLIVIGAGVAIVLIPCFKEIKIGEISLKQAIEKQKEETK